jgi:hypothetical protein
LADEASKSEQARAKRLGLKPGESWRLPAKGKPQGNLEQLSRRDDFPEIMREVGATMSGGKGDNWSKRRGISLDEWAARYERINWNDGYDTERRNHDKPVACSRGCPGCLCGLRGMAECKAKKEEG